MTQLLKARVLLLAILLALLAILWRLQSPPRPDVRLIGLAVRATLFALPTATPQRIVVTQIVVVTATPLSTPTPAPTITPMPTATLAPTATRAPALPALAAASQAEPGAAPSSPAVLPAAAEDGGDAVGALLPTLLSCPIASDRQYTVIPVSGGGLEHPAEEHADLNLAVRGYQPVAAANLLFDHDGPVDGDPTQLTGLLASAPAFVQSYAVYDWDWQCAPHGCRGQALTQPEVSLIALATTPGAPVGVAWRDQQIYAGGYKALVLYAEATRITLGYTREDSVAGGYVVHIENVCVDPALLALYDANAAAGRALLPAVRNEDLIGVAASADLLVAVRDRGAFLDPRMRRNWWQGK